MPFTNPKRHRAYRAGYQKSYRLDATTTDLDAHRKALRLEFGQDPWWEDISRGFEAGLSNRKGEQMRERQAQWFQKHKKRLRRHQLKKRRAAGAERAIAVLQHTMRKLAS